MRYQQVRFLAAAAAARAAAGTRSCLSVSVHAKQLVRQATCDGSTSCMGGVRVRVPTAFFLWIWKPS